MTNAASEDLYCTLRLTEYFPRWICFVVRGLHKIRPSSIGSSEDRLDLFRCVRMLTRFDIVQFLTQSSRQSDSVIAVDTALID
jgi:hypothetical protein